jgi:4-amino-4-deoxy-L-arabinose transferase-like glycosyltransferase
MHRDATVKESRRSRWLLPTLIFVVALLPRLAPLGRYVTPDEPAWVYRSIRFSQALASGDLAATPATGHPGVTTMWLGSLGLQVQRWIAPQASADHLDWLNGLAGLSPESPAAYYHLASFLPAGRILVALTTSLGLVAIFALARRLWGLWTASLATLLLALDPFLAGHSGLLHLDGLLATTMALSVLAALLAVCSPIGKRERVLSYRWVTLSGMLAGLALLTKTPGGILAPFTALVFTAAWFTRRVSGRRAITALLLWGLVAALTCLALYPALWAEPVTTLRGLLDVGERHIESALRPIFFHGQFTYDPGLFFYPLVWLFRVSPLVLIGLPVAFFTTLRRPGHRRFALVALAALALGFGLFVAVAGKKHDRYLLPAFPPLTFVAALGWEEIVRLAHRKLNFRIPNSWLVPTALILIQLLLILPYWSAPLAYFNPILGGPRGAVNWLPVGWGEGLGAAARWLNQAPAAEQLIVATPSIPPFASFFAGQTVLLTQDTRSQADYVVYPPQQDAEQLPPDDPSLVYSHKVGGLSYASVFRNAAPEEQAAYLDDHTRAGDLILLDAEAALSRLYDGPADLIVLADARDPTQVAARLDVLVPGREKLWYVASPAASPITARYIQEQLTCRGQPISSETIAGATISQVALNASHDASSCETLRGTEHAARFGDALVLIEALFPVDAVAWPDALPLVARWGALAQLSADYRAVLHLKDESGRTWVEGGQEILNADYMRPSAWPSGDWSDQTFQLALPPALPPGQYSVELGVFDPASGQGLSAWAADGQFAGLTVSLGQTTVAPPLHPPPPGKVAMGERFDPPPTAGPLVLLGENPPPDRIVSGDRVSFDLFWQASTAPGGDYTLRWRLLSPDGSIARVEAMPLGPYPTARWREQELAQIRYDLPIPPDLPAGDYTLTINVLGADGASLWASDYTLAPVTILARDRLFSLPQQIDYPLDLRLGAVAYLRGFDLPQPVGDDVAALVTQPGDHIPLTLYWQADDPTDVGYTVFVHLVGPDGMLHGQVDRPPAGGAAPTFSWARGQVVIDEISLPILADAPPGVYHVAAGLYDPINGDRLPVYDVAGAELPNRQIVLPIEVTVE